MVNKYCIDYSALIFVNTLDLALAPPNLWRVKKHMLLAILVSSTLKYSGDNDVRSIFAIRWLCVSFSPTVRADSTAVVITSLTSQPAVSSISSKERTRLCHVVPALYSGPGVPTRILSPAVNPDSLLCSEASRKLWVRRRLMSFNVRLSGGSGVVVCPLPRTNDKMSVSTAPRIFKACHSRTVLATSFQFKAFNSKLHFPIKYRPVIWLIISICNT